MRGLILILLLLPTHLFAETNYWLESLSHNAAGHIATPDLQKAMVAFTKEDFADCQNQLKLSNEKASKYFLFTPIQISKQNISTFLVYPSKYCYSFFGAHSVQFWLVRKQHDGSYNILLSAREDGIEVLPSTTNGYSDLKLYYGLDETIYSFNGTSYNKKEKR